MPTPTKGPRLGGSPAHQRLMPVSNDAQKQERAAWASFARALFRTNEFLYVD